MTTPDAGAGLDRRQFLQLGAISTVSLLALSTVGGLAGCSSQHRPQPGHAWLTAADLALFQALLPVVNGSAYIAAPAVAGLALQRIDLMCASLQAPAQAQTRQLLDLLQWRAFRRLACGFSEDWAEASAGNVAAFLARWRDSRLGLFNAGYRGLVKLSAVAFWSQPASWPASRYPGPPAWAVSALQE